MTFIDTNVLLDVFTNDPHWCSWSETQLEQAALRGNLIINDIIYAEVSVRFETIDLVDAAFNKAQITHAAMPHTALFLAGKIFQRYRSAGGVRTNILPDFLIGAHATVTGASLITRDTRPYKTYFPTLTLIAPTP